MSRLYKIGNYAMVTIAAPVKVTTGTAIKTMLQVQASANTPLVVVEWGIDFDGSALACFVVAGIVGSRPGNLIAVAGSLLMALRGPALHHLTVIEQGELLGVRFGPLPLFRRTVRYDDIERVEVGRTLLSTGGASTTASGAAGSGTCGAGIVSSYI